MALLKHIFLEHGKLMEKPKAVPNFDFFSEQNKQQCTITTMITFHHYTHTNEKH